MRNFKNILVPTDFSALAEGALQVAVEIAFQANADITLLHVIDVPGIGTASGTAMDTFGQSGGTSSDPIRQKYMMGLMQATQQKIADLKAKYSKVAIKDLVAFDRVQDHISKFVVEQETDLIVMGTKGDSSSIKAFSVGSNTQKVVRYAKVPVLSIAKGDSSFLPRNIVCASTFEDFPEVGIRTLKFFQTYFGSAIHFVKVVTRESFEPSTDVINAINAFIKKHDFSNCTANIFNHYTDAEGIVAFANSVNANMVSLATNGRTGIGHMLLGSVTEQLVNNADLPVLCFHLED